MKDGELICEETIGEGRFTATWSAENHAVRGKWRPAFSFQSLIGVESEEGIPLAIDALRKSSQFVAESIARIGDAELNGRLAQDLKEVMNGS